MSAALWALIAIGYVNGQPAEVEIGPQASQAECVANAQKSLDEVTKHIPKELQVVYKCVDLGSVPNAASGFGKADSL